MAMLTQSYLMWRDANLRVLNEEIARLRIAGTVSELARRMIRSSADTGILRMVRAYEEAAAAPALLTAAPRAELIVSGV